MLLLFLRQPCSLVDNLTHTMTDGRFCLYGNITGLLFAKKQCVCGCVCVCVCVWSCVPVRASAPAFPCLFAFNLILFIIHVKTYSSKNILKMYDIIYSKLNWLRCFFNNSATTVENSTGSLTICYRSFSSINCPRFLRILYNSYILLNTASRGTFNATSQE
jgi:hypothetical protein